MKAELIKPGDETIKLITPKNNGWFTTSELMLLIGGFPEQVSLSTGLVMVVDEDGLNKDLPINERATNLYKMGRETYAEDVERMARKARKAGINVVTIGDPNDLTIRGIVVVCERRMIK